MLSKGWHILLTNESINSGSREVNAADTDEEKSTGAFFERGGEVCFWRNRPSIPSKHRRQA